MNILDQIVARKRSDLAGWKEKTTLKELEASPFFTVPGISLKEHLLRPDKSGIISEFKRHSPSKGPLNPQASVGKVTVGYREAGASGLSILTEEPFFHGHNRDLIEARGLNPCPILRKDFIIDEWQVWETKSIGADAMLLIASILTPAETRSLGKQAKSLGLEVLLEVHDGQELDEHLNEYVDLVGVNNRNLKTFVTSIDHSLELAEKIPADRVRISESGLDSPEQLETLYKAGFRGFLMGEKFMRHPNPEELAARFMKDWMMRREKM